uniref:Myomesin 3 n=1 Tax=Denticeps clupeoides TaxID=299321 RepID=A0AAY4BH32_9TELE
ENLFSKCFWSWSWSLQAEKKAKEHMKYLEDLSMKAPDFPIPLRPHTVWEGMAVKLSCTLQGCPPPTILQDFMVNHSMDLTAQKSITVKLIREAEMNVLLSNSRKTFVIFCLCSGQCLKPSNRLGLQTSLRSASLSLRGMHKEQEGFYSARLHTSDGVVEHRTYIYVKDASAAVLGGPGSPLQVEVSDVNKGYVSLRWQPPSADGASAVEGYYIERCDIGVSEWVRCNQDVQRMCCYPVMGLMENTIYQFRVCAVNQAGVGRPSRPTQPVLTCDPNDLFSTLIGQIRVPFPPTNVRVCELSDTYAVLRWNEPEPRGREPLTFFVERSIEGKNSWQLTSLDMAVISPRFVEFGLQKGKSYCFRVRSVNKYGVSDPSVPMTVLDWPPPPACGVQAVRDTDSSILLLWKEPWDKESILGYYLYCSEAGKEEWRTINNKPITSNRFTVHGLTSRKQYVFRVKSVGRAGNSQYSEQSEPVMVKSAVLLTAFSGAPSPASGFALLLCTASEMLISWRAPAHNGGDPIRGYYLDQRQKARSAWREVNTAPVKERVYKVSNLLEGHYYQFRVFAANISGIGKPSEPSEFFQCEEWTMPQPGCPYDLEFREVRRSSLVLLWAVPLYEGQSAVSGYLVEISQGVESEEWIPVTSEPVQDTYLKVSGLNAGQTYRLRVSAVNQAGVGMPSLVSEPITTQTKPGTREMEIGVDNDGFIYLSFESADISENNLFVWSKNYREAIDATRVRMESKPNKSTLTFNNPTKDDLGLYTVEMSDDTDISSSYTFTAEDLERLTELGWHIRNPLIALKSGWNVDISEQGGVRLWLQTEALSNAAELQLILNDREISSTPARKINFDKANGLVEIQFEQLAREDEGSYTAQLRDGRAKNQFTLVLVDEIAYQRFFVLLGPHFEEFLSWRVTGDCEMIMTCKVTNVNKDTKLRWFKDDVEITDIITDPSGVSIFTVPQVNNPLLSWANRSITLEQAYQHSQNSIKMEFDFNPKRHAASVIRSEISRLVSFRERRIDQDERTKPGSTMQKLWIEIFKPTENDKGKYILEMFDGVEAHKRSLDLSGQAFEDAMLEYQRLKQVAIAEKNRARVTKGLPDVVAIMEDKSLCLTCFADGDPDPEMFWMKNDMEIVTRDQYHISKEHKCSTLTINSVTMEDSGNYSIFVRNQYGSQTVNVTVSVYKHGEKPPPDANVMLVSLVLLEFFSFFNILRSSPISRELYQIKILLKSEDTLKVKHCSVSAENMVFQSRSCQLSGSVT